MDENFHFKKKYGQNFLRDFQLVDKIARSAQIKENSLVVEVGPGSGILTKCLAKYASQVVCFEIDKTLQDTLDKILLEHDNIDIYYEDFLKVNLCDILDKYSYQNLYFVSNVPYYITMPIIMKLTECNRTFSSIVMMVQKEVGERFCSAPGSKDYGSITVYLNYFYDIKKCFFVGRENFVPRPNVDSIVLRLVPKEKLALKNQEVFFKLVRDSFQFRRKTLRNNLKNYDLKKIESVLEKYQKNLNVRAEELDVSLFVAIANALDV